MTTKEEACSWKLQEAKEEIQQLHQQLNIYINQRDQLDKCHFERDELAKGVLELQQEREKCLARERDLWPDIDRPTEPTITPRGMPRRIIPPPPRAPPAAAPNNFDGGTRRLKKQYRKHTRRNIHKRKKHTRKSKTKKQPQNRNTRKSKTRRS